MILSLLLALLVTVSGALATYIYDRDASPGARLCTGACIGLAAFGLIGFVLASFAGLTATTTALATIVTAAPFALLLNSERREQVQTELTESTHAIRRAIARPTGRDVGYFLYYAVAAVLLWLIFDRAMLQRSDGIYTGVLNNFGDLPFHLSVITSFAYGQNFPPEDPTFAGVRFTYPFLTDFISAVFVRGGADLRDSMFIENFLLAVSFVGVLHRWAWEMLRDRVAALLTPLLVLLNGGFGWVLLFTAARKGDQGLTGVLTHLPASFTVIPDTAWRWGNAISALLVPQRGILLGLPLAVIVFTQWWLATRGEESIDAEKRGRGDAGKGRQGNGAAGRQKPGAKKKSKTNQNLTAGRAASDFRVPASPRLRASAMVSASPTARMIAAGLIAGMLPLVHAHSFVAVMAVGACMALLHLVLLQKHLRQWIVFGVVASAIALPQLWWSTHQSAVNSSSFFSFAFGWDSGKENYFDLKLAGSQFLQTMPRVRAALLHAPDAALFWFKNTGLFIPLLIVALLLRGKKPLVSRPLLLFYLPFTLCFIIPNVMTLAPWVWDNIKILFYWWLASAPLVALLLSRLWRSGATQRAIAVALLACLTLAGALDVAGIVLRSGEYQLFDPYGVRFAEVIRQQTQPRSLIIHAPVHNTPVFLTGRRSLMGYPGHIWTHGLDFGPRESEIKRIYSGAPDAELLLKENRVDYAVVGPLEKLVLSVNEPFFSRFQKVGEAGEYRLYKISP